MVIRFHTLSSTTYCFVTEIFPYVPGLVYVLDVKWLIAQYISARYILSLPLTEPISVRPDINIL